jgi:hypothetical protein
MSSTLTKRKKYRTKNGKKFYYHTATNKQFNIIADFLIFLIFVSLLPVAINFWYGMGVKISFLRSSSAWEALELQS